jgi:redox-sensitive bicupin YhaK (pirin superfamily)
VIEAMPWQTPDPFLFCVHHVDHYPRGNDALGPAASLAGRDLGQDFAGVDGWRMYHGGAVPGFPQHPHRGFETVTIVRRGVIDHSDSLGATARYGAGDVQWLTAGRGICHSETFPLLRPDQDNPLELFQIWLNLPGTDKLAEPHFSMLWRETIPIVRVVDDAGRATDVTVVAGRLGERQAPAPPTRSWAARPEAEVAIWTVRMDPGARFELPTGGAGVNRALYLFGGERARLGDASLVPGQGAALPADRPATLIAGDQEAEILLLQGRPIGEPVAQYGPFVMNTRQEIVQAFGDYRDTQFGGWPWPSDEPVHPRGEGRFARRPDGEVERPPAPPRG